jgi:hypothetical protein
VGTVFCSTQPEWRDTYICCIMRAFTHWPACACLSTSRQLGQSCHPSVCISYNAYVCTSSTGSSCKQKLAHSVRKPNFEIFSSWGISALENSRTSRFQFSLLRRSAADALFMIVWDFSPKFKPTLRSYVMVRSSKQVQKRRFPKPSITSRCTNN